MVYGLKNLEHNEKKAMKYYQKSAAAGNCQAKMAAALNLQRTIIQKVNKNGTWHEDITSEHLDDLENQKMHRQKLILLEQVAEKEYRCPFLLHSAMKGQSSFQLPPYMQKLHEKIQGCDHGNKKAKAIDKRHQYIARLLLVQRLSKMHRCCVHVIDVILSNIAHVNVNRMIGLHITFAAWNYLQGSEKLMSRPLIIKRREKRLLRPMKWKGV